MLCCTCGGVRAPPGRDGWRARARGPSAPAATRPPARTAPPRPRPPSACPAHAALVAYILPACMRLHRLSAHQSSLLAAPEFFQAMSTLPITTAPRGPAGHAPALIMLKSFGHSTYGESSGSLKTKPLCMSVQSFPRPLWPPFVMRTRGLVLPPPMEMCSSTNSGNVTTGAPAHSSAGTAVTRVHASRALDPHCACTHRIQSLKTRPSLQQF